MEFIYSDGGRSKYFKGEADDCVTRAIANATGKDYKEVYDAINELSKSERTGKRKKSRSSARNGVYRRTYEKYLSSIGWCFKPLMLIGSGCKIHLNETDLETAGISKGVYILSLSGHLTVIKDGVVYDTFNDDRDGTRCIYGYYYKAT